MAYTITLSNGTTLTTIDNNVLDTTTSLSLIGRNFSGYGGSVAENFVHLLENFANTVAPSNPLTGQLWFNSAIGRLQIWLSSAWRDINTLTGGITIQEITADNAGLTLYDPSAPSGSRYYRIRIRDDGLFAGHWVLESLQDDGLTVSTVILNTDNVGAIKLAATPSTGDNSTLIATTGFVKNQGYAPLLSPVFIGAPAINGSGSGAVLELQGDGSNPNKFIRASLGHFQVVNSANTVVLLDVSDAGVVVAPVGTIQATGQVIIDGTAGLPGAVLKLAGNGVTTPTKWLRATNGHFQVVNSADTVVILDLDDAGVLNTTGAIGAGGPITATGAVTASGGKLRAGVGAFGSGDPNAATILNDFQTNFTQPGHTFLPNGLMIQWWWSGAFGDAGGDTANLLSLPTAFPNFHLWSIVSFGGVGIPGTPPYYTSNPGISAEPYDRFRVEIVVALGAAPVTYGVSILSIGY